MVFVGLKGGRNFVDAHREWLIRFWILSGVYRLEGVVSLGLLCGMRL